MRKISGFEKTSGRPLDILYAGSDSQLAFVKSRFFGRTSAEKFLGRHFAPLLNHVARREDCQMTVAVQQSAARRFLPNAGYVLPLWVTSIADCSKPLSKIPSTSLKTDLRHIRKYGLSCVESSDPEDAWFFWDRMHVPYAKAHFGDEALIESREDFARQVESNQLRLFFVMREGRRIAGGMGNYQAEIPFFRYLGIRDADPEARKIGALAAIYIFELELAREMGCPEVNFGGSRPFVNDGVLQFKKKFDIRLENSSCRRVLYINPLTVDEAVTACLTSNPIIRLDGQELVATVFADERGDSPVSDKLWQFRGELLRGLERVERVTLKRYARPHVRTLSLNQS